MAGEREREQQELNWIFPGKIETEKERELTWIFFFKLGDGVGKAISNKIWGEQCMGNRQSLPVSTSRNNHILKHNLLH